MNWWEDSVIRPLDTGLSDVVASVSPMLSRVVNYNYVNEFQILDMPGEKCKCPLPAYLNNLIHLRNKVILVFVLDFTNEEKNRGHSANLFSEIYNTALAFSSAKNDLKTIFVVNKVDCMNTNSKQNLDNFVNFQLGNILLRSPFTTEKSYWWVRQIRKNYKVIPYSSYMFNMGLGADGNDIQC